MRIIAVKSIMMLGATEGTRGGKRPLSHILRKEMHEDVFDTLSRWIEQVDGIVKSVFTSSPSEIKNKLDDSVQRSVQRLRLKMSRDRSSRPSAIQAMKLLDKGSRIWKKLGFIEEKPNDRVLQSVKEKCLGRIRDIAGSQANNRVASHDMAETLIRIEHDCHKQLQHLSDRVPQGEIRAAIAGVEAKLEEAREGAKIKRIAEIRDKAVATIMRSQEGGGMVEIEAFHEIDEIAGKVSSGMDRSGHSAEVFEAGQFAKQQIRMAMQEKPLSVKQAPVARKPSAIEFGGHFMDYRAIKAPHGDSQSVKVTYSKKISDLGGIRKKCVLDIRKACENAGRASELRDSVNKIYLSCKAQLVEISGPNVDVTTASRQLEQELADARDKASIKEIDEIKAHFSRANEHGYITRGEVFDEYRQVVREIVAEAESRGDKSGWIGHASDVVSAGLKALEYMA